MKESLVVRSRLKEVILKYGKDKVNNVSGDFASELSKKVEESRDKEP